VGTEGWGRERRKPGPSGEAVAGDENSLLVLSLASWENSLAHGNLGPTLPE
jgi:hypothetical protein